MKLDFTKMHGCGNDYIYINCLKRQIKYPEKLAVQLSDRHFSIGGDGIVLICKSDKADAKMRMFNIDGSEGKMCGNAIRCVAKYLYDRDICKKKTISIETLSGIKTLQLHTANGRVATVTVDMGKADFDPKTIPVALPGESVIRYPAKIGGQTVEITCVSMGNPHCVVFGDDPANLELEKIGPKFENNPLFPERVNTEFIQVLDEKTLKMRVWERGSGETLACGTGACAAVAAACANGYCQKDTDVLVHLTGGDLTIRYTDEHVYMTGPAVIAFDGTVKISAKEMGD